MESSEYGEVDLDGGEFPNPKYKYRIVEIPVVFRVVNSIFGELSNSPSRMPAYGVPFSSQEFANTEVATIYMRRLVEQYPNIKLYECDGKVVFDVRGPSGGVVVNQIFYILKK